MVYIMEDAQIKRFCRPIYWLVNTKPLHGSHPVHCTVVQNRQNLSKNSISIKISIKITKTSFLYIFSYLSIIQVCVGIYWSRQNHCTGCTQYTAQWAKIIKICPKSLIFPKFLKFIIKFMLKSISCSTQTTAQAVVQKLQDLSKKSQFRITNTKIPLSFIWLFGIIGFYSYSNRFQHQKYRISLNNVQGH